MSKHVLSEDVVERRIDDSGRLITKRLLSKTNKMPKWAERFLNTNRVLVVEESIVDPNSRTFVTFTRNVGLKSYLTIEEKVTYTVAPDNDHFTLTARQAWINSNMFGISRAVQAFAVERFKHNCDKARKGYQLVLDTMFNQNYETSNLHNGHLHPLLMEKLKERAKNISDKAKSKAIPMIKAAINSDRQ